MKPLPPPPPVSSTSATASREGSVNYSLINTFREAWRKEKIGEKPKTYQDEIIGMMILIIGTDCKTVEDKAATALYMMRTMDSW
jgi:hypothetical protein